MTWPCRVGVVPPPVDCRQDRPADALLAESTAKAVVVCQVLSGLGGVGKTELVANLAHRCWDGREVDLLVWVTATSRAGIATTLAEAAIKVTGIDDSDPERGAARLLAWLAEPHGRRWLIVFDDLADPDDLTGLWPPASPSGRVVLTTRRRDTALLAGRQVIDVDVFTPDQAVAYLESKFTTQPGRLDEAAELAADLSYLPLALAQATAYILDRGARMTCATYRQRLADQRRSLGDLAPDALPDQHRATVAATWSLSVERADQLAPSGVARPVLELAALLDPNAIPADLFTTEPVLAYCAARLGRQITADDTDDALHLLHRFNLLTVDERSNEIRVHALVQRAVREAIQADHQPSLAQAAADALIDLWRDAKRDHTHAQPLRSNTAVLHRNVGDALLTPRCHPVLLLAGQSMGKSGQPDAATSYYTSLHGDCERVFGPSTRVTLDLRDDIAYWKAKAGRPDAAVIELQDLLADYLREFGADDEETMIVRSHLAQFQGEAGDASGAVRAFDLLLSDRMRLLGPDHPSTLITRHDISYWRGEAGDPAGAAEAAEALVADRERLFGPEDREALNVRHNLYYRWGEAGEPARAARALESLVHDMSRVHGPDDPHTLAARRNFARFRGEAGDPAGAALLLESLLTDQRRALERDHPDVRVTLVWLVHWRGAAGDAGGATSASEQLLAERLRILGPDHPDTLKARLWIAYWALQAEDLPTVVVALHTLHTDQLRVLGPDHPDTRATRHKLTHWQGQMGDRVDDFHHTE